MKAILVALFVSVSSAYPKKFKEDPLHHPDISFAIELSWTPTFLTVGKFSVVSAFPFCF